MALELQPIGLRDANAFVAKLHRHSKPVRGQKLSVAVADENGIRGVAIWGRPVSREIQANPFAMEILRVCTDGARNACSKLYAACCWAAKGAGFRLAVTYTLASEGGASLRAAGFKPVAEVKDRQWDCPSRPREERDHRAAESSSSSGTRRPGGFTAVSVSRRSAARHHGSARPR